MKSYTDLEQSKKLAEILPIESADMHYYYNNDFDELESIPTITEEDDHFVLFPEDVRCWSLAALLKVLPNYQLQTQDDGIGILCYYKRKFSIITADNPVDACVAMIEKIHKILI